MDDEFITEEEFVEEVRKHVCRFDGQKQAAKSLFVSLGTLQATICQYKHPGPTILDSMDYERVWMYRRKRTNGQNKTVASRP
jgi:hypothetical protein